MGGVYNPFEVENKLNTINRGCSLTKGAVQSIPNNAWTILIWDVEEWDTDSFHDGSDAGIVIPTDLAGRYLVVVMIRFAGNATGRRGLRITTDVADLIAQFDVTVVSAQNAYVQLSRIVEFPFSGRLNFRAEAFQNSGIAINVHTDRVFFQVLKVG